MSNERDKTILELVELTSVDKVNDFIPIVEQASNETKKVSASNLPVSTAQQTALDLKADDADLTAHTGNTSNPHSVTATQVGLGNVDNTSDADKPVSTAQQAALDLKADDADLTSHTGNTSNPHSVTAAQVGLGNVDNTSDADKPVSTAQQTALDLKADATALTTETNARIDADNRREFAGGVALDGASGLFNVQSLAGATAIDQTPTISFNWDAQNTNNNQRIVNFGNWPVSGGFSINAFSSNVKQIYFNFKQSGSNNDYSQFVSDSNVFDFGKIVQITAIINPLGPTLYINGSLVNLTQLTAPNGTYGEGSTNLYIGNSETSVLNRYTKGSISNVAIFNTALTATQAAELYQQGLQPWLAANPEYRRGLSDPTYQSDFSSGTDGWGGLGDEDGVTVSQNSTGIGGEINTLVATVDTSNGVHVFWDDLDRYNGTGLFKIKFDVYIPSSQNIKGVQVLVSSGGSNVFQPTLNPTLDSWTTYQSNEFIRTAADSNRILFYLRDENGREFTGNGTDFAHFKNIEITQLGSLATLPLNDDCRQLKDISGNRNDATASESGVTHLKQANQHSFRDDHADGTGGSYLIANADILAENEVITGVTVDGRFHAASGDQDLTKRRIKLEDHGSHVDIKRSNGTTDDAAIAVTNPSDGTDFAITVLTQRI